MLYVFEMSYKIFVYFAKKKSHQTRLNSTNLEYYKLLSLSFTHTYIVDKSKISFFSLLIVNFSFLFQCTILKFDLLQIVEMTDNLKFISCKLPNGSLFL